MKRCEIDTSMFKQQSELSVSIYEDAAATVTVAEILQSAEWRRT